MAWEPSVQYLNLLMAAHVSQWKAKNSMSCEILTSSLNPRSLYLYETISYSVSLYFTPGTLAHVYAVHYFFFLEYCHFPQILFSYLLGSLSLLFLILLSYYLPSELSPNHAVLHFNSASAPRTPYHHSLS